MDDDTGWTTWLLAVWSSELRDAVVARIEQASIGHRGWVVRALLDSEGARPGWTETLHALVLAAIRDETGADLEVMGSQAAWEAYDQVWDALAKRFADGGPLAQVPLGREPEVTRLMATLPSQAAAHLAADVTGERPDPLWLGGRLRIDLDGLRAYRRLDAGQLPSDVAAALRAIERLVED